MKITNNHTGPIGLPDGLVLLPNQPTPVDGWDQIKKNKVVQGWLQAKILTVSGTDSGDASASGSDAGGDSGKGGVDKDALIARAKELGIDAKGNWGVPKLQAAIAEAEKALASGSNPGGEGQS